MLMLQGSFFRTSSRAYSTAPRSICLLQVQQTALPKINTFYVPGYSENFQEIPGRWYGENEGQNRYMQTNATKDGKGSYTSNSSCPRVGSIRLEKQAVDFIIWASQKLHGIH